MNKFLFLLFFLSIVSSQSLIAGNKVPQLGKDPINKVISAMTLEEKAQLLVGRGQNNISNKDYIVSGAAGMTISIPRLGIPSTVESDGPAGLRIDPRRKEDSKTYYCTGFPIATLLSSTWNTDVVEEVGAAMGNEVLEYGCDVLLAPGMNIHRNPLCGRNFEYYSEDPLLTGKIAAAMVNGVQSQGVGTSIKHFAANNQETFRMQNSSNISQRALRELYLKGFEIAVKESHPWTIMSSYNKINGAYTQEDYSLLTSLLREDWGYKGIVMTDWTGLRNTKAQVHAGNDLMMPGKSDQVKEIILAVKSGKLSISDVDRNVKRMLEFIMKTPRFKKYNYTNKPDLKAHAFITRKSADEGIILLKNDDNTLPLKTESGDIALFGVGSYNFLAGGTGSGDVNKAYVINMYQGLKNAGFELQPKLNSFYEKYIEAENVQIKELNGKKAWWQVFMPEEAKIIPEYIKNRAKDSEVAVITFFRSSGEGHDRHKTEGDFLLTKKERDILENVTKSFHAVNKKVIVVLNIGGVIETASWKNIPDAIILAWQPGQEGGNSVADIIKGNVNPSGKLTMTFPVRYSDVPSSKNFPSDYQGEKFNTDKKDIGYTDYDEGLWIGYRYFNTFDKSVSYPFGYGLSYTTFDYAAGAKIKKSGKSYTVAVKITNTGKVAGKEVAELYISAPKGKLEKPAMELKAFTKTKLLQPGESEIVTMTFNLHDLASFDESINSWITDNGKYKVSIGSSVQDVRQTIFFDVKNVYKEKMKAKI